MRILLAGYRNDFLENTRNMLTGLDEKVDMDVVRNRKMFSKMIDEKDYDAVIPDNEMQDEKNIGFWKKLEKGGYRVPFVVCRTNCFRKKNMESFETENDVHAEIFDNPETRFKDGIRCCPGADILYFPQISNDGDAQQIFPSECEFFFHIFFKKLT